MILEYLPAIIIVAISVFSCVGIYGLLNWGSTADLGPAFYSYNTGRSS